MSPAVSPSVVARIFGSTLRGKGVAVEGNYLFVGWSTHQLHEMEQMVTRSFMWGLSASIALALVGGVLAGRRIMRKIESVSETTREIVAGDLTRRVLSSTAGDEFDHLAVSINSMLDRIQSLMGELQQVTTDIAHDLRTPLSRLRQRLESAQRPDVSTAELREIVAGTVGEVTTPWASSARCFASRRSRAAPGGRDLPPLT